MIYSTILIDFPWRYKTPGWKGGADRHYPTLPVEAFHEMPLKEISDVNTHFWLWCTDTFLEDMGSILASHNLVKRATFNWVKLNANPMSSKQIEEYKERRAKDGEGFWSPVLYKGDVYGLEEQYSVAWGNGYYGRSDCEYLILATNKNCKSIPVSHKARHTHKTFHAPIGRHSEKPEEAYELIRRYSPGPRLECFARDNHEGFDLWGNEIKVTADIPVLDAWGERVTNTYQ